MVNILVNRIGEYLRQNFKKEGKAIQSNRNNTLTNKIFISKVVFLLTFTIIECLYYKGPMAFYAKGN